LNLSSLIALLTLLLWRLFLSLLETTKDAEEQLVLQEAASSLPLLLGLEEV
jgi:hypothetical protein